MERFTWEGVLPLVPKLSWAVRGVAEAWTLATCLLEGPCPLVVMVCSLLLFCLLPHTQWDVWALAGLSWNGLWI